MLYSNKTAKHHWKHQLMMVVPNVLSSVRSLWKVPSIQRMPGAIFSYRIYNLEKEVRKTSLIEGDETFLPVSFTAISWKVDWILQSHIPLGDAPIQSQALCHTLLLLLAPPGSCLSAFPLCHSLPSAVLLCSLQSPCRVGCVFAFTFGCLKEAEFAKWSDANWIFLSPFQAYLTDFLCQFAQQPCYAMFSDHLNENEKRVLQAIGI